MAEKRELVKDEPRRFYAFPFIALALLLFGITSINFYRNPDNPLNEFISDNILNRNSRPDEKARSLLYKAIEYKNNGWVERARAILVKASRLDPQGQSGHSAAVFLSVAIPRNPVSELASYENIEAYNLMAAGKESEAIRKFQEMINQYPNFEWPYGNLASMYLDQGKLADAKPLIDKALEINPCYLNGLRYKIQLLSLQKDLSGARQVADHAMTCLGPREKLDPALTPLYDDFDQYSSRINRAQARRR